MEMDFGVFLEPALVLLMGVEIYANTTWISIDGPHLMFPPDET
jgi:hypothetical protein